MTENEFIFELKKLNIVISNIQLEQFKRYYDLLISWNEKINLTAIIEKEQVYLKHFYDSITLSKIINLDDDIELCDVGSGAGFPGIVLKIIFPRLKVILVDSLNKRVNFLNLVIEELDLKNIVAIHSRVEEFAIRNRNKFDIVTARAVAPLNILSEYCVPLVRVNKFFIPLKANIEKELSICTKAFQELNINIVEKMEFNLPNNNGYRTLLKFQKNKDNIKYPRKNADIKKKSL